MTSIPDSPPQPKPSARKSNWTPRAKKPREIVIYRCAACQRISGLRGMPPFEKIELPGKPTIYVHGAPLRCRQVYVARVTKPEAVTLEDIDRAMAQRDAQRAQDSVPT